MGRGLTVEAGRCLLEDRQDADEIHRADVTIHAVHNGVATTDDLPGDLENLV